MVNGSTTWSHKAHNCSIICWLSTYRKVCKCDQAPFPDSWLGPGDATRGDTVDDTIICSGTSSSMNGGCDNGWSVARVSNCVLFLVLYVHPHTRQTHIVFYVHYVVSFPDPPPWWKWSWMFMLSLLTCTVNTIYSWDNIHTYRLVGAPRL